MSVYEALLKFQAEVPALQRDKINPHFGSPYVSLESLMGELVPRLNALGLVLIQAPSSLGDGPSVVPALTTVLRHVESETEISSTMPLILDRDTAQGQGSGITYGRRYALMSILGLTADEDDDGNAAVAGGGSPSRGSSRTRGSVGRSTTSKESSGTTPKF